jgi:hypothetical protein
MNNIPFAITINSKNYYGYLSTGDVLDPPRVYFVFLRNKIVGELVYLDKWVFQQGGRYEPLGRLNRGQLDNIAEYLGDIATGVYG